MHDCSLRLWVLGAGTWTIYPESGEATDLESERLPILRDPEGAHTVVLEVADDASATTLHYRNINGNELEAASAPGLVSHLRWSPNGDRIVFTVGRSASGGGVVQDLFLWDLDSEAAPMQITNTGAAFGAEWRGTMPRWDDV
jgi:Tol biopolymer transport system component